MNYLDIVKEIQDIARQCGRDPSDITLVAVTKGHALNEVMPAYEAGCRDFGENRVPEALTKIPLAPDDILWHFIGTLQKNKVRKVVGKFALIHSVDSVDLAQKISQMSQEMGVTTPVLLQSNTSEEKAKHGLTPDAWRAKIEEVLALPGIAVEGLMTMAPYVQDERILRQCFVRLRRLRDDINLHHLSMGMTNDYRIAIEEGATLLRIGTAIFG